MTIHQVVGLYEVSPGVYHGSDGYVYLAHPTDPRPSMATKVGKITSDGQQISLSEFL